MPDPSQRLKTPKATDPKPNLKLSSSLQSLQADAVVEASLITKIWEADSGVILWTNSTARKKKVASLLADSDGNINFDGSDPEEVYSRLISEIVYVHTGDFRSHYEYRSVE